MKNAILCFASLLIALLLFLASIACASPPDTVLHPVDTNLAVHFVEISTNYEIEQDSIDASDPILVPFASDILAIAKEQHVPAALLAGIVQEESKFDEWAERSEPSYERNPTITKQAKAWSKAHGGIPTALTEERDRSRSMGLMQTMGQTAREQGLSNRYLSVLFAPRESLRQGAVKLHALLKRYGKDTLAAITAYNQGSAHMVHGTYVIARYGYRVSTAWQTYKEIFSHNHYRDINENMGESSALRIAHRHRLAALSTDSAAATKRTIDSSHVSALVGGASGPRDPRYTPRYDYSEDAGHISAGESARGNGFGEDIPYRAEPGFFTMACLTLGMGLLGFLALFGYAGHSAGQLESLLQPPDRYIPSLYRPGNAVQAERSHRFFARHALHTSRQYTDRSHNA